MAKKSITERIARGKARAKGIMSGGKAIVTAGAIGAAGGFGVDVVADHVEFVGNNWYGGPLVEFGAALLLHGKSRTAAIALAGAAGERAQFNYKLKSFQDGNRQDSPVRVFGGQQQQQQPQLPAGGAKGLDDAGFLMAPGEAA